MKMFDKVKNLFTEEIEDVKSPKNEIKYQADEVEEEKKFQAEKIEIKELPKKEEKSVFFDDSDFEDLEKKPVIVKVENNLAYNGKLNTIKAVEEKRIFKPTPIISPIYGVLDTNYSKDQITEKKIIVNHQSNDDVTIDDVRNRAFSTLEDELKNDLLGNDYKFETINVPVSDELEIFSEQIDPIEEFEDIVKTRSTKNKDVIEKSIDDEDTEFLSQKLDEQKKKLDEITQILRNKPNITSNITLVEINEDDEPTIEDEIIEELPIIDEDIDTKDIEEEIIEDNIDDVFANSIDDLDVAIKETKSEKMDDKKLFDIIDSIYDEDGGNK